MLAGLEAVDGIVERYDGDESALIQMLLDIQGEYRWLPKGALLRLSERLGVPLNRIYQVASFYKAFSLSPRGRHEVSVCLGTACHVRGSLRILDKAVEALEIAPGQTTRDGKFSLYTVNCLGCCALGPVMVVDGDYYGKLPSSQVDGILANYD